MGDLTGTSTLVTAELQAQQPLTVPQLSVLLKCDWQGVQSCVNGMIRRGEVVRLKGQPGKPWAYRLRGDA